MKTVKNMTRTWAVLLGFVAMLMAATGKTLLENLDKASTWDDVMTPWIAASLLSTLGVSIVGWLMQSPVQMLEEWRVEKRRNGIINNKPPTSKGGQSVT